MGAGAGSVVDLVVLELAVAGLAEVGSAAEGCSLPEMQPQCHMF